MHTHAVDHRQPSAGTPAGRWLTNKVAVVTVEVIHGHATWHLPAEVNLIFHRGRRFGQLPSVRLITLDHFHHGRGNAFVLSGVNTRSGRTFAFPAHTTSARTSTCGLSESSPTAPVGTAEEAQPCVPAALAVTECLTKAAEGRNYLFWLAA